MSRKLNHITLIVNDKEKSAKFYELALGLSRTCRITEQICPYGGVWYDLDEDIQLHIWQRDYSVVKSEQHFALVVDDFNVLIKKIVEYGGRVEETKLLPGCKYRAYVYDPEGNRIELMELESSGSS
ncbi:MAG: VOC family protein [Oligoflexia bacterium]|nr:VOC family protein [Oligoflexia bacterium]